MFNVFILIYSRLFNFKLKTLQVLWILEILSNSTFNNIFVYFKLIQNKFLFILLIPIYNFSRFHIWINKRQYFCGMLISIKLKCMHPYKSLYISSMLQTYWSTDYTVIGYQLNKLFNKVLIDINSNFFN